MMLDFIYCLTFLTEGFLWVSLASLGESKFFEGGSKILFPEVPTEPVHRVETQLVSKTHLLLDLWATSQVSHPSASLTC